MNDTPTKFRDFLGRIERTKLEHRALVEMQRRKLGLKEDGSKKHMSKQLRELVRISGDDSQIKALDFKLRAKQREQYWSDVHAAIQSINGTHEAV